jgi:hypothetical protein
MSITGGDTRTPGAAAGAGRTGIRVPQSAARKDVRANELTRDGRRTAVRFRDPAFPESRRAAYSIASSTLSNS